MTAKPLAIAAAIAAVLFAACGPPPAATGPRAGQAVVVVTSNVDDAQVYVDGRYIGLLANVHAGMAIDAGHHRIELRREDYFSRYAELDVTRAQHTQLDLEMSPVLP